MGGSGLFFLKNGLELVTFLEKWVGVGVGVVFIKKMGGSGLFFLKNGWGGSLFLKIGGNGLFLLKNEWEWVAFVKK